METGGMPLCVTRGIYSLLPIGPAQHQLVSNLAAWGGIVFLLRIRGANRWGLCHQRILGRRDSARPTKGSRDEHQAQAGADRERHAKGQEIEFQHFLTLSARGRIEYCGEQWSDAEGNQNQGGKPFPAG
jgi:hypothetical protein